MTPKPPARAEHILLEGDFEPIVEERKQPHRIVRRSCTLQSPVRGCTTELSILDGHYLSVRCTRPKGEPLTYQFDLRFARPQPVRVHRIAWAWLFTALGLAAIAAALISTSMSLPALSRWGAAVAAVCGAAGAFVLFVRRTTELLEFRSVHGRAPLISVQGGIGGARDRKAFFVEVIKSINAAKLERAQPKQQFLRDEMREHFRLHELGALTERQYETSKARILSAH